MARIGRLFTGFFLAFTLIVAASYMDGYWWGFELLSHLRVQFAAGAVIFLVFFLMRRRYVTAAAAAILLVFNMIPLAPYLMPNLAAQAGSGGAKLRVMTLNLHQQQADLDGLRRLVRQEKPDMVLITEFRTAPQQFLRDLDDILPYRAGSPRAGLFRLLLLSRLPIADMRLHRPSLEFLPVMEARLCMPYAVMGDCLTVLGLHAARPGGAATGWRDAMIKFVAGRAEAIDDGRVIVMGDLNTTPWSRILQQLLRMGNLTDSAIGSPFRASWTSRNPLFGLPLDQVLVGKGFGVTGRRVGASIGSDHFPVIADIALPAPTSVK